LLRRPPIGGVLVLADDAGWRSMGGSGPVSVLSNCESGSGASLGAPSGGRSARAGAHRHQPVLRVGGIAKSDRPRSGWVATPGGIQPSDRWHMRSETFADMPVVMPVWSVCAS
jgi:hypothetical protein